MTEGDLVVAEVQQISNMDKSINLHIRNESFGKLKSGALLQVSPDLIKKQKRHMIDLSMGIKLILAMNGWVWVELIDEEDDEGYEKIAKLLNILKIFNELYVAIRIQDMLNCYNLCKGKKASEIPFSPMRDHIVDYLVKAVNQISKEKIGEIISGEDN